MDIDSGYCYIVPPYKQASTLPIGFLITHGMELVIPETLCQFTGLCDKNGKKIWENDILMAHLDESYPEDMASMSRYIRGHRTPKGTVISNIANALHTTTDYLLGLEAKGNEPYRMDQNIILKSIVYYGKEIQSTVCMEECAELIQAVSKMIRGSGELSDDDYDHLAEEIADVLICVEMLKQIYDIENLRVKHWIERKQKRILNRMEK